MGIFLNNVRLIAQKMNLPLPVGEMNESTDEQGHVSANWCVDNDAPLNQWLEVRLNKNHASFKEAWKKGPQAFEDVVVLVLTHENEHIKQYLELEKQLGERTRITFFVGSLYKKYGYWENPLEVSARQAETSTVNTAAVIEAILKENAECIPAEDAF